jgi:capsular polysaccharide biosynthesis protein
MSDFFDNRQILDLIRKRFIHFVIIGIAAVAFSALFSAPAFIKPKFRSTAKLYPINLAVMSMESETEQMMEVINSNDIKLRMFDAFKLDVVYKIIKNDPHYLTNLMGEYDGNVSTRKTEFETVELAVMDEDPHRAAQMCDSVIHFYNEKVREMHTAKNWEMVKILSDNLVLRNREKDSLLQILNKQRGQYQILDFNTQVREVTRGYMDALSSGRESTSGGREIKTLYKNLSDKGGEAYIVENQFRKTINTIDSLRFLYNINLSEAQKRITYCFVVQKPYPADKKAYPVRWMIVAFTTFAALFLALLLFVFLDYRTKK